MGKEVTGHHAQKQAVKLHNYEFICSTSLFLQMDSKCLKFLMEFIKILVYL